MTSISTRSDSRGSRGQTRTNSFTGPFSALRSIAFPDADGDAPSFRRITPQPASRTMPPIAQTNAAVRPARTGRRAGPAHVFRCPT